MKTHKYRAFLLQLIVGTFLLLTTQSQAWRPSGWVYWTGYYAYASSEDTWYYVDGAEYLYSSNLQTGASEPMNWVDSWVWFDWPYYQDSADGSGHWVQEGENWASNYTTGAWSRLGEESWGTNWVDDNSWEDDSSGSSEGNSGSGSLYDGQTLWVSQDWDRDAVVKITGNSGAQQPVVILLHGSGGSPEQMISNWSHIGSAVYVALRGANTDWNVPAGNGYLDDVDFVRQIINQVKGYNNVDTSNITVLGYSNGGSLVNRLLLETSGGLFQNAISLASPLAATQYDGSFWADYDGSGGYYSQTWPEYRRTLTIHGDADYINPYWGGPDNIGVYLTDARTSAYALASAMGYQGGQPGGWWEYNDAERFDYDGYVTHYRLEGGDHGLNTYNGGNTTYSIVRDFIGLY